MIVQEKEKNKTNINNFNNFGIELNSIAIKAMIDMYSEKELAVVRELLTNSWDSHIRAKTQHIPIVLDVFETDSQIFRIRDYGTGISKKDMQNYCTIYASDKRDTNSQTGYFGVGSKVPFAIVDSYLVNSYYNGIKYSYVMDISDTMPKFALLSETKTEEHNGLEVIIPINQDYIIKGIKKAVRTICSTTKINVDVYLADFEKYTPIYKGDGLRLFAVKSKTGLRYSPFDVYTINYGNNEYGGCISTSRVKTSLYELKKIVSRDSYVATLQTIDYLADSSDTLKVIVDIPLDANLEVIPNRENLSLKEQDKDFIALEICKVICNNITKELTVTELHRTKNNKHFLKKLESKLHNIARAYARYSQSFGGYIYSENSYELYGYRYNTDRYNCLFTYDNRTKFYERLFSGYNVLELVNRLNTIVKDNKLSLDIVFLSKIIDYNGSVSQLRKRLEKAKRYLRDYVVTCCYNSYKIFNIALKVFKNLHPEIDLDIKVYKLQQVTKITKPTRTETKKYGSSKVVLQMQLTDMGITTLSKAIKLVKENNVNYVFYGQYTDYVKNLLCFLDENYKFMPDYLKQKVSSILYKTTGISTPISKKNFAIVGLDPHDTEKIEYLKNNLPDKLTIYFGQITDFVQDLQAYLDTQTSDAFSIITEQTNESYNFCIKQAQHKRIMKLLSIFEKRPPTTKIGKKIHNVYRRLYNKTIPFLLYRYLRKSRPYAIERNKNRVKKLDKKVKKLLRNLYEIDFLLFRIKRTNNTYCKGFHYILDDGLDYNTILKKCYKGIS